jgi:glycosyltransferase involved in cell wall biosynthesis
MFNHERYVREQLESLQAQWRPDIDLLVIDDGSEDGSMDVAARFLSANGAMPATMLRNALPRNVGAFESILKYTRSDILIQADSDDICLPGRIDKILDCFVRDPNCRLVTSNAFRTNGDIVLGLLNANYEDCVFADPIEAARKAGEIRCVGATSAMHRSIIEMFPLDVELCPFVFDQISFFRAVLLGTHHYLAEPLVGWRQHGSNTSHIMGMNDRHDEAQERWLTLNVMALAQKIRDVEHINAIFPNNEVFEEVIDTANTCFLEWFSTWSRVRNRLGYASTVSSKRQQVAIPPVMTLRLGQRENFGIAERVGRIAWEWGGFHAPEMEWNWVAHQAVFVFRAPDACTLRLKVCGHGNGSEQQVRLSAWSKLAPIGFAVCEATIEPVEIAMTLKERQDVEPIILHFSISAAIRPSDLDENSTETRQLGIRVFWIEVD